MRNKTGELLTDDTPRYSSININRKGGYTPEDICIQLKAKHFVTCPVADNEYMCVEDDCYCCECFDVINSTEHTIHCNGIFSEYEQKWVNRLKEKTIRDWAASGGELGQ